MTSAYILILAVLVLGGLIATLGDRLGSKVGKARLRLFKLRPRQTATVVTIVTGIIISASTLGILFALSESLRKGVFELDDILRKRRQDIRELIEQLEVVKVQKQEIERELSQAKNERIKAQEKLNAINKSLQEALEFQDATAIKFKETQQKIALLQKDFQRAQNQLQAVTQQADNLRSEIRELQSNRQELIRQRNRVKAEIQERDRLLLERDAEIAQRDAEITKRDAEITKRDTEITKRDAEITKREEEIAQRDAEIAQRDAEITKREEEIAQRDAEIAQRDAEISQRDAEITKRDSEITKRDSEIAQRDAEITKREEEIAQRDSEIERREEEIAERDAEITKRDAEIAERQEEIQEREEEIADRDRSIAEQDRTIAEKEGLLLDLENKQAFLERSVLELEQNFQLLREGNVAVLRNQVLASGVLRILEPSATRQAVEQLLEAANLKAIERVWPGAAEFDEQIVKITAAEVEQLIDRIDDGRDYVVRILSAGNYLVGEKSIRVFADAALNQKVFAKGEIVAETSIVPSQLTREELEERIDLLLATVSFRSRRAGILSERIQIGDGSISSLIQFIEKLQQHREKVTLQAIAAESTYTAGPLQLVLAVVRDEEVIFQTQ